MLRRYWFGGSYIPSRFLNGLPVMIVLEAFFVYLRVPNLHLMYIISELELMRLC